MFIESYGHPGLTPLPISICLYVTTIVTYKWFTDKQYKSYFVVGIVVLCILLSLLFCKSKKFSLPIRFTPTV